LIRNALLLAAMTAAISLNAAAAGPSAESLAARIEQQATPLPYEPWTKTARVGDYIVRKLATGPVTRTEVREIDADYVYVDEVSDVQGRKTERKRKYLRNENTLKMREVEMKSSGTFKQKVNGQKLNCEAFDGYIVTVLKEWNGTTTAMKLAKYHKVVAEGVPFGGVIRELQAPDDKREVTPNAGGGFVKLMNTIETTQVVMEVTDWGNSVDERKK
jgi:hypothetical protein